MQIGIIMKYNSQLKFDKSLKSIILEKLSQTIEKSFTVLGIQFQDDM